MPRLPIIRPRQLIAVLSKLGFAEHRQSGTSHLVFRNQDGRRAVVPMHSRDIPKGTLRAILRDIDISPQELIGLL